MNLPLVTLRDASVGFGDKLLFRDISFSILPGDRISLIGRNGSGKSTLMKVIAGEIELDSGEYFVQPGTRIGYLPQQIMPEPGQRVYDYVLKGIPQEEGDQLYKADMLLGPLELDGEALMTDLSGGQQRRAALAHALLDAPDVLMLDEPTNHLDIGAIEWLEDWLKTYPGGVLCISHDRAFLAHVTGRIFWLRQGRVLVHGKGYAHYDSWSEEVERQEVLALQKLGRKLEEEEHWRQRGVTARRKRNMRRMAELKTLRQRLQQRKGQLAQAGHVVNLPPLDAEQAAKMVLELEGVHKSYENKQIIRPFSMRLLRGEKIGLIGKNGSGKTTFLKLLTGEEKPSGGKIRRGWGLEISCFEQDRSSLDPEKSLWRTLCPEGGDQVKVGGKYRHVVAYLKDFLFDPKQAQSPVSSLSGGEANRLLLARILANPGNLLILDEPTNDLDMDTLDMLQDVLADYEGTLLVVSHDRDFLDRVVEKTLIFEGNGIIKEFFGGYEEFLQQKMKKEEARRQKQAGKEEAKEHTAGTLPPKRVSAKLSFKYKHALETLPGEIEELAVRIRGIELKLADPELYASDPERFHTLTKELEILQGRKKGKEEDWLEAELAREEAEAS